MKFHRIVFLALAAWILSGAPVLAAQRGTPPGPPDFTSFLAQVRAAKFADYAGRPAVRVKSARDFQAMKKHILALYRGVSVEHSFTDRGQIVDCIPIGQQPGLRRPGAKPEALVREPPAPVAAPKPERAGKSRQPTRAIDLALKPGEKDARGEEQYCKPGTVPMRRITLEEMTRFDNLNDYFGKERDTDEMQKEQQPQDRRGEQLPSDYSKHYYARGVQFVDNHGADSWLNLWNPTVPDRNQFSLSQQWIVAGTGDAKQTAEGGWQVYPRKYGTNNAALFIYYTTAGYSNGSGCYNLDCAGFVLIANNVYLGRGFNHYSTDGGTQWGFNLQWKRDHSGNWWLFYRGPGPYIAVGYYPHSLFGSGALASKAGKIAFGGETTGTDRNFQMGSGGFANTGWTHAAFQNKIFYIDTSDISRWANLGKTETNPACYTADLHNIYGNWGTYIYFGGPGCP